MDTIFNFIIFELFFILMIFGISILVIEKIVISYFKRRLNNDKKNK